MGRDDERSDRRCPAPTRCGSPSTASHRRSRSSSRKHPLRNTPDADLAAQFNLAIQIRDKISEANNAVIQIRKIKEEVKDRLAKSQDAQLKAAGDALTTSLSAVEEEIYQVKNQSGQDPLNFPIKINNRLASLLGMTLRGEGKPTANIYADLQGPEGGAEGGDRPAGQGAGDGTRGVQRRGEARRRGSGRRHVRRGWLPAPHRYFSVKVSSMFTWTPRARRPSCRA